MCIASKYLDEFDQMLHRIEEDFKKLSTKQSEYDTLVSEHYHKIETKNFNACEGYYLSKQLQKLLRERRIVKDEFSKLNTVKQLLELKKLNNSMEKTKASVNKYKDKCKNWKQTWDNTYKIEEILH